MAAQFLRELPSAAYHVVGIKLFLVEHPFTMVVEMLILEFWMFSNNLKILEEEFKYHQQARMNQEETSRKLDKIEIAFKI